MCERTWRLKTILILILIRDDEQQLEGSPGPVEMFRTDVLVDVLVVRLGQVRLGKE